MARINPGALPVAVRQTSATVTGMTGVAPKKGTTEYIPAYNSGRYDYADPADPSLIVLDDGGLFEFDETVVVVEIRAQLAPAAPIPPPNDGTFGVVIEDRDGTHSTVVIPLGTNGVDKRFAYPAGGVPVLRGQRVKISTTREGSIALYIRKGDQY
jgi:hypothetical protein